MAATDRQSTDQSCARATAAAQEVVMEACEGIDGEMVEVAPEVFVFVPDDRRDEFDVDPADLRPDDDAEPAIESCMDSEWARDWAESVLGPDASADAIEAAKRRACEGLFDAA